jgi:hypothetical protein
MPSENAHEPDALWYHENKLIVRGGELILDKVPISIRNGKKSYSASDGGFITYRGQFLAKNGRDYISLRPFMSDYYFFPIGPNACEPYSRVNIFPIKVTNRGFWVEGVLYTKQPIRADRLKAFEEMLKSKPLTYDWEHRYDGKYQMSACQPNDLSVLDD